MDNERAFTEWCYKTYVEERSTHSVETLSYIELVIKYLKCTTAEEEYEVLGHMESHKKAVFKHKVKEKRYSWMTIPLANRGSETVLTVPKRNGDGYLIVCPLEKFYSTLKGIHESTGHARKYTMWRMITASYAGLPRTVVDKFLKLCAICKCKAAKENKQELEYVQAAEVLEKIQVWGKADNNDNSTPAEEVVRELEQKKKAAPKRKIASSSAAKQSAKQKKGGKQRVQLEVDYDSDSSEEESGFYKLGKHGAKRKKIRMQRAWMESDYDWDDSEDEEHSEYVIYKSPYGKMARRKKRKRTLTVDLKKTHPSVRIKGTENNYNPVQCFDTNCRDTTPHMHCPFCVKTDCYTDPVILKAHYRVKHVDKGIDFAGLKVLRCCDRCDIVGVIKGEKKFKGAHWHCYKCKNGFNRRDEAIKHYKTHFRNPQTTFQIQIAQEVNQSVTQGFETDEASVAIPSEEFSVQSIHPVLTEAVTCMASTEDHTFSQTSSFPVVAKLDGNVAMPGVGAIETVDVSDTQTIMIIQDDQLQDTCVTQDISADDAFTKTTVLDDSPKQSHDHTIHSLIDTIQKLQENNNEKDREIESLKKKVQDKDEEINRLKEREQELLVQLKSPDDKKIQELRGQLEAQHKELIQQQLSQLRKTFYQTHNLQPKILIVNNSLNAQLDQQIGLDSCTINTDSSGSISLEFNDPNTTVNPSDGSVSTSDTRVIDIGNNSSGVIGEKCDGKDFEMLEQEFTDPLEEERHKIGDGSVQFDRDRQEPPVKKRKEK